MSLRRPLVLHFPVDKNKNHLTNLTTLVGFEEHGKTFCQLFSDSCVQFGEQEHPLSWPLEKK